MIHDLHWLMFWNYASGFFSAAFIILALFEKEKKKKKKKYACDCGDPIQCNKWCNAKIKFTKDHL